jgi:DNA-directed RNA polymerase subunit RPC12/RpoP
VSNDPPPISSEHQQSPHQLPGEAVDDGKGRVFPCEECGADVTFHIGSQALKCPYCGHVKQLDLDPEAEILEQDFDAMIARIEEQHEADRHDEEGQCEVRCGSCGGTVVFIGTLTSSACPYCGTPIQRDKIHSATHRIPVDAVIPFHVDHERARQNLAEWVRSRWFAPNAFLKQGVSGNFNGVYLPYWTFDTLTFNSYSGQRGDAYYVTVGSGKNRRTVRKVRWSSASGQFQRFFDNVTIPASRGLDMNRLIALEPWPFGKSIPFTQQVLAGFLARTYDISLQEGFVAAKERVDSAIESDVRRRIGGDEQRISSINSRYDAITFKHLLLPVWLMTYRFHEKPYRVYINAATGEVQGDRPYSWVKITLAVLAALVVVAIIAAAQQR